MLHMVKSAGKAIALLAKLDHLHYVIFMFKAEIIYDNIFNLISKYKKKIKDRCILSAIEKQENVFRTIVSHAYWQESLYLIRCIKL